MKKILFVAAWLTFANCTKQDVSPTNNTVTKSSKTSIAAPPTILVIGTINYLGDPEMDGLGWVISLDKSRFLKPINLPKKFEDEGARVEVAYLETEEIFPCRCLEKIFMIEIVSIEKL